MFKLLWKTTKWLAALLLLTPLLILAALLLWGVESHPLVLPAQTMNYEHVTRLHKILKTHDPRRMRAGEVKQLVTAQDDLNLMLQYGLSHVRETGAKVELQKDRATLRLSAGLRPLKIDGYLNADMTLARTGQDYRLEQVRIGGIELPDLIAGPVSGGLHWLLLHVKPYREVIGSINELEFQPRQMRLVYQWRPELIRKMLLAQRELFSSPQQQARVEHYRKQILTISQQLHIVTPAPYLLAPLFEIAHRRSADAQQAVAENSALLSALGAYMIGTQADKLLGAPQSASQQQVKRRYLTLRGRYDLAQHFILSAYLANAAGQGVAQGVGLFKEFKDSQGGTGFSFADLAADRAGQDFARLALHPRTAQQVQQLMRASTDEDRFMPVVEQLPEGIQEIEFKARFGSLDSADYRLLETEIEKRLAACRLFALIVDVNTAGQ